MTYNRLKMNIAKYHNMKRIREFKRQFSGASVWQQDSFSYCASLMPSCHDPSSGAHPVPAAHNENEMDAAVWKQVRIVRNHLDPGCVRPKGPFLFRLS